MGSRCILSTYIICSIQVTPDQNGNGSLFRPNRLQSIGFCCSNCSLDSRFEKKKRGRIPAFQQGHRSGPMIPTQKSPAQGTWARSSLPNVMENPTRFYLTRLAHHPYLKQLDLLEKLKQVIKAQLGLAQSLTLVGHLGLRKIWHVF